MCLFLSEITVLNKSFFFSVRVLKLKAFTELLLNIIEKVAK